LLQEITNKIKGDSSSLQIEDVSAIKRTPSSESAAGQLSIISPSTLSASVNHLAPPAHPIAVEDWAVVTATIDMLP